MNFPHSQNNSRPHLLRWRLVILAATTLMVSTSCGGSGFVETRSDEPVQVTPLDPSETVPGGGFGVFDGEWVLIAGPRDQVPTGLPLELVVEDATSTVVARTACNQLSGSYTLSDDGSASISLPGATKKACEPGHEQLQDEAKALLEAVTAWERSADQIRLTGPDFELVFHLAG